MLDGIERFDLKKPIGRQHLRPLMWLLCAPDLIAHRQKTVKINMEGVKPPYLLLCNHNAFMDFKVATMAVFPHRTNYVVAIDGFLKREGLLRYIGCICKRKFTRDIQLVKQLRRVTDRGDIAAIYPEARYSLCGTTAVLPEAIGQLAKFLRVPVVTLICHGHHINSPFFNLPDHHVKGLRAEMTCILSEEDVKNKSPEELSAAINQAFVYDDYRWQKENGIRVTYQKRAEGLHKVLYQCPHCQTEYKMSSSGVTLRCGACGKEWEMTELGELCAKSGETEFSHIPDWYEWERANVRREVEEGRYSFTCKARIDALPNPKGYIDLGEGELTHDMDGFTLKGFDGKKRFEKHWSVPTLYSCHIEYEYLGKYGDCVDLNTEEDTLYIYPKDCAFSVTKMALATEELYTHYWKEKPLPRVNAAAGGEE